ncbi:MAG: YbaK/EbsC family protein [Chloroflexota bacterium]
MANRRSDTVFSDSLPARVLAGFAAVDRTAPDRFLLRLAAAGIPHERRRHEPARHARHLAAIWSVALHIAGRATLFYADGAAALAVVPADRKVAAPRLRNLLGASDLRVLRGDRGVGRVGWRGLPGEPGALPAIPDTFHARCLVDELVLNSPRLVISVDAGRSVALAPADYVRVVGAETARFVGATRLLPGGGMVTEGGESHFVPTSPKRRGDE